MLPQKIFAVGDIHIFNSKRFDEHRYIFDRFYEQIDSESPDLIVITGDVIDSKLKLSPEQTDLLRDFLLNVANRAEVIMIPGNHDLQVNNSDRLDSLTPTVYALIDQTAYPIHYLKHSGIYTIRSIDWAVWSCVDGQRSPFEDGAGHKSYTIGLYHGVISGSENNDGYQLTGGIEVSEFEKCDMVIASDIHMQQSFREGEINYTGSMLQVTVTEDPEGSFLVYDRIGDGYSKPRVVRLPNIYSTIDITPDDIITDILSTQKVRIKYDSDKTTRASINEMAKDIEKTHGVRVLTSPVIKKKDSSVIKTINSPGVVLDASNILGYFDAFAAKAQDRLGITMDDLPQLKEYEKEFGGGDVKEFEYGDFFVSRMEIDNMLSYGPGTNVVDLSTPGLLGIVGKNRCGKSSIIKLLQFAMFNEMPSNSSPIKMINKFNRSKPGTVTLYVTKAGEEYKIVRTLNPDKKQKAVSIDLGFFRMSGDTMLDNLTRESRPYTDKELQKFLGLNETFEMLSLFSAQKRQQEFIDCKNTERLKLVNKFLGLQAFEMKEEAVKKVITEKNAVYQNMMKQFDKNINAASINADIKRFNTLLKLEQNSVQELNSELIELEEMYKEVRAAYTSNNRIASRNIDDPIILRGRLVELDERAEAVRKVIVADVNEAIRIRAEIEGGMEEFNKKYGIHPGDYVAPEGELLELEKKLAVLKSDIDRLIKQKGMTSCNTCGRDFAEAHMEGVTTKLRELEAVRDTMQADIKSKKDTMTICLKEIKIMEDAWDEAEKLETDEPLKNDNKLKTIEIESSKIKALIDEYDTVQSAKQIVQILEDKVTEYDDRKREISTQLDPKHREIGKYESQIREAKNRLKAYGDKIKVLDDLENEIRLLKAYRKIVTKDGLPMYILMSNLDEINEKINVIVGQVFPFVLDFTVDDEKGDLKIQFSYEGDPDKNDVSLASGSETFIINLCIKVALSQISTLPKIDCVFIDEGYDSLDKETIEKIPALFSILTNYYKNVITISHLDEIKDMCSGQISLERPGRYTVIR